MVLTSEFYEQDAITVAKGLLGKRMHVGSRSAIITQTESYLGEEDLASHARFGRTKRSSILYEQGGILYVYLIYGIHFCTNVVVGKKDMPSAVLIRGAKTDDGLIINGPGKFSQYLGITTKFNYTSLLANKDVHIEDELDISPDMIQSGKRIGVLYAKEWADALYRFWI